MQHRWVMVVALCAACGGERNTSTEPELPATPTIVESELVADECVDELIDKLLWRRSEGAAGCGLVRYSAR